MIFLRDFIATPPFISSLAVALFAFSLCIVRFIADNFVEQYEPGKIIKYSVITLCTGVSLQGLAPKVVAIFGFTQAGTVVIFPLAIFAAAQRRDRLTTVNVAVLAQLSFLVFY